MQVQRKVLRWRKKHEFCSLSTSRSYDAVKRKHCGEESRGGTKEKDDQALALKNAELQAQEQRELAKIELEAGIADDKDLSKYSFYQAQAKRWNDANKNDSTKKIAVASFTGVEYIDPNVKQEKPEKQDPITRLSPFAHIIGDSKDMDVVYFPEDGDMDAYHKRLSTTKNRLYSGKMCSGLCTELKGEKVTRVRTTVCGR